MEFVRFEKKNWSYRGDKGTWVGIDTKKETLTAKKAESGIISSEYAEELQKYLENYGVSFEDLRCGEKVTVALNN